MTRLGSPRAPGAAHFGLVEAFKFLGRGPSDRELGLAIDLLRESGVEVDYDDALVEIATANGSSAFVALDLATAWNCGIENLRRTAPAARRFE